MTRFERNFIILVVVAVLVTVAAAVLAHEPQGLIQNIQREEGWRGSCYTDTTGHATIAYGIKLPLTRSEGVMLLRERLTGIEKCVERSWPPYDSQPENVREALLGASYALGCAGLLSFRKALAAIAAGDLDRAGDEFRDSRWYRQAPLRVEGVLSRLTVGQ